MTFTSAGSTTASSPSGRILVQKSEREAYDDALAAMKQANFDITQEDKPSLIGFAYSKKSMSVTANFPVTYAGTLTVTPADGGKSSVTMTSQVNWGSAAPVFLTIGVLFIVMLFIPMVQWLAFPTALISAGFTAWNLASKTPQDAANAILGQVQRG